MMWRKLGYVKHQYCVYTVKYVSQDSIKEAESLWCFEMRDLLYRFMVPAGNEKSKRGNRVIKKSLSYQSAKTIMSRPKYVSEKGQLLV